MNNFNDALIGGVQSQLNNGTTWSSIVPRYQVSLTDPYINELLQAFIQFHGFNVADQAHIAQLHTTIYLRFVSTTMSAINPKLTKRALKEGVVVDPGNTTPLQSGFSQVTLPEEWSSDYQPLSQKYP